MFTFSTHITTTPFQAILGSWAIDDDTVPWVLQHSFEGVPDDDTCLMNGRVVIGFRGERFLSSWFQTVNSS